MTDKQTAFLSKYISNNMIDILYERGNAHTSNAIDFIIKTIYKDYTLFDIEVNLDTRLNEYTINKLKVILNYNKELYSGPHDKSYNICNVFTIPESNNIYYRFYQSWCKGMSNSITKHFIIVDKDGCEVKYNTQYEELFKMDISTLSEFFKYLQRNKF